MERGRVLDSDVWGLRVGDVEKMMGKRRRRGWAVSDVDYTAVDSVQTAVKMDAKLQFW